MQDKWLALTEKHNMGKRRLARSIEAGRVLTPKELEPNQSQIYACGGGKTVVATGCGNGPSLKSSHTARFQTPHNIAKALKSEFEKRPEGH
jgi:hypothetical protein